MKTAFVVFAFVLGTALASHAAATATGTASAAATTGSTAAATVGSSNAIADIEGTAAPTTALKRPTVDEIVAAVKAVEQSADNKGYEKFIDTMKWDLPRDKVIEDLFKRYRDYDAALARRPETSSRKRMAEVFTKDNPPAKKQGSRFIIVCPKRIAVVRGGKTEMADADTVYNLENILLAAETAFAKTTSSLLMDRFINWSGPSQGIIFLIPDHATFLRLRKGAADSSPVQTVATEDERREFYVYANPAHSEVLDQAIGYAVAQLVLKEYSTVTSKQTTLRSKLPEFLACGLAAQAAGLKATIALDGPHQVKNYDGRQLTPSDILKFMARAKAGDLTSDLLPLEPNQLYSCDKLVGLRGFPSDNEKTYYFFRQSQAVVEYLQKNGGLATIALANDLAQGRSMDKSFDSTYVKVRQAVQGKEADTKKDRKLDKDERKEARRDEKKAEKESKASEAESKYTPDDLLRGFKEFSSRAKDAIFMPLTEKLEATKKK